MRKHKIYKYIIVFLHSFDICMRNDMTWHTSSHSLLFCMLRILFKQPSCCLGKFCGKASLLPLSTDFVKCWTPFSQSSLKNANRNWPCLIQTAHAPQTSAVICAKLLFLQAACTPISQAIHTPGSHAVWSLLSLRKPLPSSWCFLHKFRPAIISSERPPLRVYTKLWEKHVVSSGALRFVLRPGWPLSVVGFLVVGMLVSPGLGSALAEASDVLGGEGGKFWLLLTPVGELSKSALNKCRWCWCNPCEHCSQECLNIWAQQLGFTGMQMPQPPGKATVQTASRAPQQISGTLFALRFVHIFQGQRP